MFNKFIHTIFNSSILIPFICAVGLSKIFIENDLKMGLWVLIGSLVLIAFQLIILKIARKQIVAKKINIYNITPYHENGILAIYITYFVPFIESYLGKSFSLGNWALILVGVLLLILSSKTINNPILRIVGYRFYSIETAQGISMVLITKRELRNKNALSKVIRLFEYYVMEV